MPVDSINIDEGGLAGDREFAVFRQGERCNAKQIPAIMFLGARWQGSALELTFPDRAAFLLDKNIEGMPATEQFRGGETPVEDMGDEVALWLSSALSEDVRLCRIREPAPFIIPLPEFTDVHGQDQSRFIDAAPVMLANQSSLDDLNSRLTTPVEMGRFRPNIVLTGLAAYQEDGLGEFHFDEVGFRQVAPCERCKVITMDPATGNTGKEPLATLAAYRRRSNDYAGGVIFGTYLSVSSPGNLSVGEVVKAV